MPGHHLAGPRDPQRAADEVDRERRVGSREPFDVGRHPFDAGPEQVEVVATPRPLEAFRLVDRDVEPAGEDEVEVVAAAGKVADGDDPAPADDADAGGP